MVERTSKIATQISSFSNHKFIHFFKGFQFFDTVTRQKVETKVARVVFCINFQNQLIFQN
jgi:hypothetical protein